MKFILKRKKKRKFVLNKTSVVADENVFRCIDFPSHISCSSHLSPPVAHSQLYRVSPMNPKSSDLKMKVTCRFKNFFKFPGVAKSTCLTIQHKICGRTLITLGNNVTKINKLKLDKRSKKAKQTLSSF